VFAAPAFALSYLAGALFLVAFHFYVSRSAPVAALDQSV
jgi:hypothetical protein